MTDYGISGAVRRKGLLNMDMGVWFRVLSRFCTAGRGLDKETTRVLCCREDWEDWILS